jgi:hypothetical protein
MTVQWNENIKNVYFIYYEVHIWCTLKERKEKRKKEPKKRKNMSVYEPEDIQMRDMWTTRFHFLHTVNFLSEEFTYTEDEWEN